MAAELPLLSGSSGDFTSTDISPLIADTPNHAVRVDAWTFLGWTETFERTKFGVDFYDEENTIIHGDVNLMCTMVSDFEPGILNLGKTSAVKLYMSSAAEANLRLEGNVRINRQPITWGRAVNQSRKDDEEFVFVVLSGRFNGAITESNS